MAKVNWISCEDRLPEKYIPVWVAMPSERRNLNWLVDIDYREDKKWHNYNNVWKYLNISEPLFWADIEYPDPPEVSLKGVIV